MQEDYDILEIGDTLTWKASSGVFLKTNKQYAVTEIIRPEITYTLKFKLKDIPDIEWEYGPPFEREVGGSL